MSFIINHKKINQISGPVSLHILKPELSFYNYFKEQYNIHTPIFILFGDIHDSKKYQCKTCKYDINKKSYCYHVYDKEFLQLLDNMSEQKYPIDFFIASEKIINYVKAKKLNIEVVLILINQYVLIIIQILVQHILDHHILIMTHKMVVMIPVIQKLIFVTLNHHHILIHPVLKNHLLNIQICQNIPVVQFIHLI